MAIEAVQDLNALQREIETGEPVFLDFWAEWCASCKAMQPAMEEAQARFQGVKFLKCNIEEAPEIGDAFGITSLPTLFLFKDGGIVNKQVGSANLSGLHGFLAPAL